MGPLDVSGGDHLAFVALFLFVWLVPRLMPSGVPVAAFARWNSRQLRLSGFAAAGPGHRLAAAISKEKGKPTRAA